MEQTAQRKEDVLLFVPNLIGQIFFLIFVVFSPMRFMIYFAKGALGVTEMKKGKRTRQD